MATNMMTEQKNYTLGMTEVEARQVAEIRGKMVVVKAFRLLRYDSTMRLRLGKA